MLLTSSSSPQAYLKIAREPAVNIQQQESANRKSACQKTIQQKTKSFHFSLFLPSSRSKHAHTYARTHNLAPCPAMSASWLPS